MSPRIEPYRGVRCLVLGATGFIGRWVARLLEQQGAELTLVSRREADLSQPGAAADVIASARPEIVFNLAGYGIDPAERDPGLAERINARLPEELAHALALLRPGPRLIHAGSAAEYGLSRGDLAEDSETNPSTTYGRTKHMGTTRLAAVCQAERVPGLTARLFSVYGPGEHPHRLLPQLERCARSGETLKLTSGAQRRDFTYVEDVAAALLRLGACEVDPGTIVNVATGMLTPVRDYVETAARLLEIPAARLEFGALPVREEEMQHKEVNVRRLHRLIGPPGLRDIEDGLRAAIREDLP